ncbi:hypothetical protein BC332_00243 [Capsicum chinense]|nr:hypothetical protein BC332_00243 [Capsicum chinense]
MVLTLSETKRSRHPDLYGKMAKLGEMPDWSYLQHELLVLIVRRLNLIEDFLNIGTVCKSWHSVAIKDNFNSDLPRAPWLMIDDEEEEEDGTTCKKFFSLYNGMILMKRNPKASGKRCMESMGWLIAVDGEISLLHPFSGVQIELPHQNTTEDYETNRTSNPWTFIWKAVLSANPSHTSDYVLMVIEGDLRFRSFWRPGDLLWTRIRKQKFSTFFIDVVYFDGRFYAINSNGSVHAWDFTGPERPKTHIIAQLPHTYVKQYYILHSLGSLFVVVQRSGSFMLPKDNWDSEEEETYVVYAFETTDFLVFQVDLTTGKVTQTENIGDSAFFLGFNASLSVQASQFPGIKANHIYFTDSYLDMYRHVIEGSLDMGVFNLADGSIRPYYEGFALSRVCPPIWVTPTLC